MVTKWLHLTELGGDPWVLPIWAAVNQAIEAKRAQPISRDLSELGVHVSARLNILPRIAVRINAEAKSLLDAARNHKPEHIFIEGKSGVTLPVDNDLKYQLIADINAFLFEVNAAAELMRKFFQLLHALAGKPIPDNELTRALREALEKADVPRDWFAMLDRDRNFVTHKGTPYLAIDISDARAWGLLVMKENLVKFDDPEKFFSLSDLQAIADGFLNAKAALQTHLIALFK